MSANINEKGPGIGNASAGITKAPRIRLGSEQVLTIGLFVGLLLISVFIPDAASQAVPDKSLFQGVIAALLAVFVIELALTKDSCQKTTDIFLILGIILLAWEVLIGKLALLAPFLFPAPGKVFAVFAEDYAVMNSGMISSFAILLSGYLLGLAAK